MDHIRRPCPCEIFPCENGPRVRHSWQPDTACIDAAQSLHTHLPPFRPIMIVSHGDSKARMHRLALWFFFSYFYSYPYFAFVIINNIPAQEHWQFSG